MPRPTMTTGAFWSAAAERAVKTMAQTAVALIGTSAVGVLDVDWQQIGSVSALAAVVSLLTSLASDRIGPAPGPSLVGEVVTPPEPIAAPGVEQAATVVPLGPDLRAEVAIRETAHRLPANPEDVIE